MTLVEVVVAIGLVATVASVFFPLLLSASRAVGRLDAQSSAVERLRVAQASIGRELRSAVCVTEPATGVGRGPTLRFTTQANRRLYEVTYRIEGGELLRRVEGESERTVTDGLGAEAAFESRAQLRTMVTVDLAAGVTGASASRGLQTTFTARNAWRPC